MYSLGKEQVWLATLINLGLALAIGGAVLVSNYKTWRSTSSSRVRSGSLGSFLLVSTVLACVSILNAVVAFAGPKEMLNVESVYKDLSRRQVWAPTLDAAILFVILTGVAFACDNLITWRCYTLGKAIRGEPIPRWKTIFVHTYIWVLSALNWMGQQIPSQVVIRQYDFHTYRTKVGGFIPGFLWILGSMLFHIAFSVTFVVTFVRSLGSLTQQIHVFEEQKIEELQVLGIKSIVFASGSLVLYFFAWFIFLSHPYHYQVNVSTTPYHLGLLLLLQGCFITKLSSLFGCGERGNSPQRGAVATAAAAAAAGQRAEGAGPASIPEEVKEEQVLSARSLIELGTLAPVAEGSEPPHHLQPRPPQPPQGASSFTSSGINLSLGVLSYGSFSSMGYATQEFVGSSSGSSMPSKSKTSGSKSDSSSQSSSKSGSRWGRGSGSSKGSRSSKSSEPSSSVGSGHGGGGDPQAEGPAVQNSDRRGRGRRQVVRHWRELFTNRSASDQAAAAPAQDEDQYQDQHHQQQEVPQDLQPPHPQTPPQPPQPPPPPPQQEGGDGGVPELHLPPPRPAHAQSPP